MVGEEGAYNSGSYSEAYNGMLKLRDLEEKQNIMKDRILLIGKNLITTKEENTEKILEIKKEIEDLKYSMERIKSLLEIISEEMSKFARRDDLEILQKQAKMFQPLEFVRKSELKKHIKQE